MNKFDEKRLGWGRENPLIKEGAKGYFSDSYKAIREMVDTDCIIPCELKDVELSSPFPYENEFGYPYKLFYVVEEALEPKYRPYSNHELLDMIGFTVREKETMKLWEVRGFKQPVMEEAFVYLRAYGSGNLLTTTNMVYKYDVTARKLLAEFTHTNGVALGKYIGGE